MSAARTALLVIDLQVGVLEGCFDAAGVVARTMALVQRARSASVPVLWVQHEDEALLHGSPAWRLAPGLLPVADEVAISKTYRDAFADTPLRTVLDGMGVTRLVVAGAQSDYCIRATTQRAVAEHYSLTLVSDAHTTTDASCDGVEITGEQVVAHTNGYFRGLRHPGVSIGIATHDVVAL